jgi:isopenicillin-N epimerase
MIMTLLSFADAWDLEPGMDFLNHGSFGACPREVLEYQRELIGEMERQPIRFLTQKMQPMLDESRRKLCRLVGAGERDLVFVQNATAGVNCVLRSLRLQPGDEILVTDHEYNACRNAAEYAAERAGAKVVLMEIPLPITGPGQIVEAVMEKVTPRTKIALLDHITSPTALIFPIAELTRRLGERGVDVLVDGAHGPGMVEFNLERIGAAYYTGNCHKWLCTPKTAGLLYVRPDRQEGIVPLVVSHGYNVPRAGYSRFQDLFDWPGTLDPTPWLCVGQTIEFLERLIPCTRHAPRVGDVAAASPQNAVTRSVTSTLAGLMRRNHELAVWARRMIAERAGLKAIGPEEMLGSMAAFELPDDLSEEGRNAPRTPMAPHRLNERIWKEYRIEVPTYYWPVAPKAVLRISVQAYNSSEQYKRLAEALGKVMKEEGRMMNDE